MTGPDEGARSAERLLLTDAGLADLEQQVSMTATWAWLPGSDLVVWSPNFFRLLAYEPGEVQPSQELFERHVHPLDLGLVDRLLPTTYPSEYRIVRRDGAVRFFRSSPASLHAAEGGLEERWTGVVQDLTDARRSDATLDAHDAVADSLARWTSLQADGEGLLCRLAVLLGCFRAALYVERGQRLLPIVFWEEPDTQSARRDEILELEIMPGEGVTGRAWTDARPICVRDLQADAPRSRSSLAENAGIRGFMSLPLVADDDVVAVASFASHAVLEPSAAELRSLDALGRIIGRSFAQRPGDLTIPLLSARERELLQLAADGIPGLDIATRLQISPETVKSHFKRIYDKLQVSDRAAAVAQAMRLNLIS